MTSGGQARPDPDPPSDPTRDAVHRDPRASYARAVAAAGAPTDRVVVSAQLGRPARGDNAVVHRCRFGLPTVVRVSPRLEDGTPFPTTFWLTCPVLRAAAGRLESEGRMQEWNRRLAEDPDLAARYATAADRYVAFRDRLGEPLPGDPTAGGMPGRVKCLHAHLAQHLATGDNPVGEATLDELAPVPCPGPCVDEDRPGTADGAGQPRSGGRGDTAGAGGSPGGGGRRRAPGDRR